ncbi:MAG TPA: doubled motif LPXTG anchor domain-containing protein [Candidatus Lachnoclostridium pullistercoris]|uniref:Doubled motif LPXTG anchor domain-containing protein n=1 Tax=Candidatus Lachnoclostridium pullistercoris TaxID=2838632 RepID=A0A9D2PBY7_9FIRM|nr:doubled motif LPXTG anchor domain-containing protein [Candidatus Lachnoclostridium pullistercoris]
MFKRRNGKCRRAAAFLLSVAMTVVSAGAGYVPAFAAETETSRFLLTSKEIRQAIRDAKAADQLLDFSQLELTGKTEKAEKSYKELLDGEQGKVYELDTDFDDSQAADGTGLQIFYNEEDDEVIFLFINESGEDVRFAVNVDGLETEGLRVKAGDSEREIEKEEESAERPEESVEEPAGAEEETSAPAEEPAGAGEESSESEEELDQAEETLAPEEEPTQTEEETSAPAEEPTGTEEEPSAPAEETAEAEEEAAVPAEKPTQAEKPEASAEETAGAKEESEVPAEEVSDSDYESSEEVSEDNEAGSDEKADSGVSSGSVSEAEDNGGQAQDSNTAEDKAESVEPSSDGEVQMGISAHHAVLVAAGTDEQATADEWILEETDENEQPELSGILKGTAYPEVSIWGGAQAAAYAVDTDELPEIISENEIQIFYIVQPEGAVTIQGPDTAEKGQGFQFTVIPAEGYQVTEVTANGEQLDWADEKNMATASQTEPAEYCYTVNNADSDQEIVITAEYAAGTVYKAETDTAFVTITAPEGAFAVPVELKARDITEEDDSYAALKEQVSEKLKTEGYIMTSFSPIDITFVDEAGNVAEPAKSVNVNIRYKNEAEAQTVSGLGHSEEAKIIHIHEENVTELEGTVREDADTGAAVLDTETSQFSVIANVTVQADGEAKVKDTVYDTLEEAVAKAESGSEIVLTADEIQLEDEIPVEKTFVIDMNGGTVKAGAGKRVFTIAEGASLTLKGEGTVSGNGEVTGYGGLVYIDGGEFRLMDSVVLTGGAAQKGGGAIYVKSSSCTLDGGVIENAKVSAYDSSVGKNTGGGAVYVQSGTLLMNDGEIRNTTANIGGGIFVRENAEFKMENGVIENTEATAYGGGGVAVKGKFIMNGGIISGAKATSPSKAYGGAVYLYGDRKTSAEFVLNGGSIEESTSAISCGGVYVDTGCVFEMNGGSIENNTAQSGAGGVSIAGAFPGPQAHFTMTGGTIRGNKVKSQSGTAGGVAVFGDFQMSGGVIADNTGMGGVYINNTQSVTVSITGGAIYNNASGSKNTNPISDIYLDYGANVKPENMDIVSAKELSDENYSFAAWIGYETTNLSDPKQIDGSLSEFLKTTASTGKKYCFMTVIEDTIGEGIYLDGVSGDDNNSGTSMIDAVRSFGKALELAKNTLDASETESVKIYVVDTVTVQGEETWSIPDEYKDKVTLVRFRTLGDYMVRVSGESATLTLENLKLDGGRDQLSTEYNYTNSIILVENSAELIIGEGTILTNNRAGVYSNDGLSYEGGALKLAYGGICRMYGGQITDNESSYAGGGVVADREAFFEMHGGEISNNKAGYRNGKVRGSGGGVAILEGSQMTMSGGTISGNQAANGGGIHVGGAAPNLKDFPENILEVTGGRISGNTAESAGGGIYVQCYSKADISGQTSITDNRANADWYVIGETGYATAYAGGGIYVNGGRSGYPNGELKLTNAAIYGNHAESSGGGIGACPTSFLGIYVTDGAVIYENTAGSQKGDQIYSSYPMNGYKHTAYVSDYMLGGGVYLWRYDDGINTGAAPRKYYQKTSQLFYLDNDYDRSDIDHAMSLADVIIAGNVSGSNGGGIGTNGNVQIGEETPEPYTLTVLKNWEDGDNAAGLRPKEITVDVSIRLTDGKVTDKKVVLKEENSWTWKLNGEDFADENGGLKAEISVDEETIERYELDPNSIEITKETEGNGQVATISFTNQFIPAEGLTVYKIWEDGENQDGIRPDQVLIQLLKNGEPEGEPVALSAENGWYYTWEELPVREQGEDLVYTVKEVGIPDGYTVQVNEVKEIDEDHYTVEVVNTHVPAVTQKTVTKLWDDNNNSDGLRPSGILVRLNADGQSVGEVELNGGNGWTYTWENLPLMKDGKEILYTAEEVAVPNGYTASYSDDTLTITNVRTSDDPNPDPDPDDPTPNNPGGSHGGGGSGPNPNTSTPSGGPGVEIITPEDVPLANLPEESVNLPEEDVPLAALPKTGDPGRTGLKTVLLGALFTALLASRRRKEEKS